ncbi:MAG: hypothetical protein J2P17_33720 [Mycobacterium sp.]|nr:hypothetical protein [Mycobacterium sp.]
MDTLDHTNVGVGREAVNAAVLRETMFDALSQMGAVHGERCGQSLGGDARRRCRWMMPTT